MSYNPSLPNAFDTGLIPVEVRDKFFEENLLSSPLEPFMGTGPLSVIQMFEKSPGTGLSLTYGFSRNLDYTNVIYDYDQISGKGQQLKFYEDTITARQQAIPDVFKGIQLEKFKTPIDVFNQLKPKLELAHKQNLTWSIFKSGTTGSYPDRTANGPSSDRVRYEGVAWNASIDAAVGAMAGTAYNQSGLNVKAIKRMRDAAIYGGANFEEEKRISPFMVEKNKSFPSPYYVYFMDTPSYQALEDDPQWNQYYFRGMKESSDQPSALSGAFYKGRIDNVMIYEVPELGKFHVTAGGNTASWNLFCGAQAFSVLWCKHPWFFHEYSNMGTIIEMAMLEIRGQKSIKFPSFKNEAINIENGIIHHFVQIA